MNIYTFNLQNKSGERPEHLEDSNGAYCYASDAKDIIKKLEEDNLRLYKLCVSAQEMALKQFYKNLK
jgi:hypothetical protein